jgi:hypothetical protein
MEGKGINLKKLQLLIPWDLGDYNIQISKFFFWVFFTMNFFGAIWKRIKSFHTTYSIPKLVLKMSTMFLP